MEKTYQVIVSGLNGENMTIDLCNTEEQMKAITVLQLKEKLGERVPGRAGMRVLRDRTDPLALSDDIQISDFIVIVQTTKLGFFMRDTDSHQRAFVI
uniref:Ubiquitin-like domain-containing protein n=1 Tax=Gadus morhua TaxID=8049 RepID=A0ABA3LC06_GADMO